MKTLKSNIKKTKIICSEYNQCKVSVLSSDTIHIYANKHLSYVTFFTDRRIILPSWSSFKKILSEILSIISLFNIETMLLTGKSVLVHLYLLYLT